MQLIEVTPEKVVAIPGGCAGRHDDHRREHAISSRPDDDGVADAGKLCAVVSQAQLVLLPKTPS